MNPILGLLNKLDTKTGIPMGDFLSAYFTGANVDPRGGTYMPYDEPLETQYGTFTSPFVESLFTPEVMQIMDEVRRQRDYDRMDANWEEQKWNWPYRGVSDIGSQVGP